MSNIYGYRWTNSFGTTPSQPWIASLYGLSNAVITEALEKCVIDGLSWPPSLPEFIGMCAGIVKSQPKKCFVAECVNGVVIKKGNINSCNAHLQDMP
jgi:hypothetical protein